MHPEQVIDITRQAMRVAIMLSAPVLVCGLVVGVLINVFQAVTQITETTLSVVPKLLAMLVAFALFAPWMIDTMTDFTTQLIQSIPNAIR